MVGKGKREPGVIAWLLPWPPVGDGAIHRDRDCHWRWYGASWGICAGFEAEVFPLALVQLEG